mmetsp:Transcript_74455/g.164457  ORF Transcript_74455/g.164457 Transcript_74455/m.164457 type:complete len:271 (-) Transcript_74455:564-1376(-)
MAAWLLGLFAARFPRAPKAIVCRRACLENLVIASTMTSMLRQAMIDDWFSGWFAAKPANAPQPEAKSSESPSNLRIAPTTSSTAPLVAAAACSSAQPAVPLIAAAPASCTAALLLCRRMAAVMASIAAQHCCVESRCWQWESQLLSTLQPATCMSAAFGCRDMSSFAKRQEAVAPQSAVAGANAARAPQKRSARPTSVSKATADLANSGHSAGVCNSSMTLDSGWYFSKRSITGSITTAVVKVSTLNVCKGPTPPLDFGRVRATRASFVP